MRIALGALSRILAWCTVLFWVATRLLGFSRLAAWIDVPAITVTWIITGSWRSYRGVHRRERTAGQASFRGSLHRACPGRAGHYRAGHRTCSRCASSGLSQVPGGLLQYFPWPPGDALSESRAGGIRLRYVPADPLLPGGLGAALQYTRNRYGPSSGMTVQVYSRQSGKKSTLASGSGYTHGSQSPAPARTVPVVTPPFPHPVACRCAACMPVPPAPGLNCTCPLCTVSLQNYAPGGIVPSPLAPSASQPPAYVPVARSRSFRGARGMDGFDGAPLVAGTASGYRWWTMRAPQLHLDPGIGASWDPGLLRGQKDIWQPGVNQACCLPPGGGPGHFFHEIPEDSCGCGYWAYWEIQQHDLGAANSLPVVGVVRASGQVIMGPRGFRAQKAEIVALHLPFRIEPDLPAFRPEDPVDRMLRGLSGRTPARPRRAVPKFTGRVISFPGAPPVPPSLGGPQPAPLPPQPAPAVPPEPEPPGEEEVRAARDRAEAWEAVIADRLQQMYPGAEVCATLDLMKAKYPVTSEYVPPEEQVRSIVCPHCGELCEKNDIHTHVLGRHGL